MMMMMMMMRILELVEVYIYLLDGEQASHHQ